MTIITLDGIRMTYRAQADINKDGRIDAVEVIQNTMDAGTQAIIQPTETGESLKELNDDEIDMGTQMSGIDLRSRLHPLQINSVVALDSLVRLKIAPTICLAYTRQMKRLVVSTNGEGRNDIIKIVSGKKELDVQQAQGGFGQSVKNWFTGGGKK